MLVPLGTRTVLVQVWEVKLGCVRLLLLDTDLEENQPWDRELSARLYGGGQDTRLQQEIVLGLGGVLALRALGVQPAVWHLNEGHAAFVVLQRIRDFLAAGQTWEQALAEVRRTTVFTTHTPVPGRSRRVRVPSGRAASGRMLGIDGRATARTSSRSATTITGQGPQFNMTALAVRTAGAVNAVSQLHREVTADMFAPLWPDVPAAERPVAAITNGVHVPTWISSELSRAARSAPEPRVARSLRGREVLGARARDLGRGSLERRGSRCARTCFSSCASGRVSAGRRTTPRRRGSWPAASCSIRTP